MLTTLPWLIAEDKWKELGIDAPEFVGNLSFRKNENEKPIIIFGQDEYIFKQFIFTTKHWVLPDGTCHVMPKEEWEGIIVSSFVSCEFEYGFPHTKSQLAHINEFRKGQDYLYAEAATVINKTKSKPKLTSLIDHWVSELILQNNRIEHLVYLVNFLCIHLLINYWFTVPLNI